MTNIVFCGDETNPVSKNLLIIQYKLFFILENIWVTNVLWHFDGSNVVNRKALKNYDPRCISLFFIFIFTFNQVSNFPYTKCSFLIYSKSKSNIVITLLIIKIIVWEENKVAWRFEIILALMAGTKKKLIKL